MSSYLKADDATATGTDFPTILSFTQPEGLPATPAGLYLLDGSMGDDVMLENLTGGSALTKIGQPASDTLGVEVGQIAAFDTGIVETAAMTFIVVANGYATGYEMLINSGVNAFADSVPDQVGLWRAGTTSSLRLNARDGSNVNQSYNSMAFSAGRAEVGKFNINIGGFDTTQFVIGYGEDATYYQEGTQAITGRTVSSPARTIRIGIGVASQYYTQQNNVAMVAIYTRLLNSSERLAAVAALRAYFATAGITTL